MPLFDFKCPKCKKEFSELVKNSDVKVNCPNCGEIAERNYTGEVVGALGKQPVKCSGNCKNCSGCH